MLIVQVRRYRRQHRMLADPSLEAVDPSDPFATGGCCACCVNDDEGRCCCCYCACCEPRGISASYILGEIPPQEALEDSELEAERCCGGDNESEEEESGHGCCCCGKEDVGDVPPVAATATTVVEEVPNATQSPTATAVVEVPNATQQQNAATVVEVPNATQQQDATTVVEVPNASQQQNAAAVQETAQNEGGTAQSPSHTQSPLPQNQEPPRIIVPSSIHLPTNSTPVLHDVRLVRAVADDGSGRTVLIALPYTVCLAFLDQWREAIRTTPVCMASHQ